MNIDQVTPHVGTKCSAASLAIHNSKVGKQYEAICIISGCSRFYRLGMAAYGFWRSWLRASIARQIDNHDTCSRYPSTWWFHLFVIDSFVIYRWICLWTPGNKKRLPVRFQLLRQTTPISNWDWYEWLIQNFLPVTLIRKLESNLSTVKCMLEHNNSNLQGNILIC